MKLAIIGGGGIRVPLLVNGLVRRGLPVAEVALFDTDRERLRLMTRLTESRAGGARISTHDDLRDCVRGSDFVVISIRVGGLDARQRDEATALRHNVVGQETVGPAGFAMAVRTVPVLTDYVRTVAEYAPKAWVINFTNPVGIVTQAMRRAADVNVVGICDTPTELFAEIAHALHLPAAHCAFDYIGLNHLGWVREVYHRGEPVLGRVWDDHLALSRLYTRPLFPAAYLSTLRLLPTEYVYYYVFPDRAVGNLRAAGTSRGEAVDMLTSQFLRTVSQHPDAIAAYETYLATRSATYMQLESGADTPQTPSPWAELTGYDRIAFDVIHAIVHNSNAIIPLNVVNNGNIPELLEDDVIEVPCVVGNSGPRALHAGALPPQVRDLVVQVKAYERNTIEAAQSMTREALVEALSTNPLVPSTSVASQLVDELVLPAFRRA